MQIHQTAAVIGRSSIVYDAPFYVLILECWSDGRYEACRIVLETTEPTGADLLLFLDRLNFRKLPWSKAVPEPPPKAKKGYRAEKRKILRECADFRHVHSMAELALKRQRAEMLADRKQGRHGNGKTRTRNASDYTAKSRGNATGGRLNGEPAPCRHLWTIHN